MYIKTDKAETIFFRQYINKQNVQSINLNNIKIKFCGLLTDSLSTCYLHKSSIHNSFIVSQKNFPFDPAKEGLRAQVQDTITSRKIVLWEDIIYKSYIRGLNFNNTYMNKVIFINTVFHGCNFNKATLVNSMFFGCMFYGCTYTQNTSNKPDTVSNDKALSDIETLCTKIGIKIPKINKHTNFVYANTGNFDIKLMGPKNTDMWLVSPIVAVSILKPYLQKVMFQYNHQTSNEKTKIVIPSSTPLFTKPTIAYNAKHASIYATTNI